MIDLHTHSLLSDGELLPWELVRRAAVTGYRGLAITDHVDPSNLEFVLKSLDKLVFWEPFVLKGVELTHVPPPKIGGLVERARRLGAELVVVHGETLVEPVAPGTNRAAIEAGVDILAHPGLITVEDAERARENGVFLEITSRRGHSLTNGHVARTALEVGAEIIVNTDAHSPGDLITRDFAVQVLRGAGVRDVEKVLSKPLNLIQKHR